MSTFTLSPIFSCYSYSNLSLSGNMVSYSILHPPDPVFCPIVFPASYRVFLSILFYPSPYHVYCFILSISALFLSFSSSVIMSILPIPWLLLLIYYILSSSMIIIPECLLFCSIHGSVIVTHKCLLFCSIHADPWSFVLLVTIHHLILSSILYSICLMIFFFSVLLYSCESWFPP